MEYPYDGFDERHNLILGVPASESRLRYSLGNCGGVERAWPSIKSGGIDWGPSALGQIPIRQGIRGGAG